MRLLPDRRRGHQRFRRLLLSDARRLPDPLPLLTRLAPGDGLVFRHYGVAGRAGQARRLARACRHRGLLFLIAGDPRLAVRVGADGVHWPQHAVRRRRFPRPLLQTAAAHDGAALVAARRAGIDAVLLSPVFATASHPGARTLGPLRLAGLARGFPGACLALGGMTPTRVRRLSGCPRLAGWAGIGALAGTPGPGPDNAR